MLLFKLAIRNIFVHKLRNSIIMIVIGIVSCILFLFLSFTDGQIENVRSSILGIVDPVSDIVIKSKGYIGAKNSNEQYEDIINRYIKNYPEIIEEIKKIPIVKEIYLKTTTVSQNIYINNKKYQDFGITGIDLNYYDYLNPKIQIVSGRYFKSSDENVILIHNNIKQNTKINIGEIVEVVGTDLFGQSVAQEFKIIGFYKAVADNPELYREAFVDLKGYCSISGLYEGEVHSINLNLNNNTSVGNGIKIFTEWAKTKKYNIEFNTFSETAEGETEIYFTVRLIIVFISLLVVLIIMFGIMSIISVNLTDRKKEIGSFYCLGAGKKFLMMLYSLEILIVNIFASISGIILGLIIREIINLLKIETQDPGVQTVFGSERFYLGMSTETILWILGGIIIITVLTSLSSLHSSLKVSPSVAVREIEE